MVIDVNLDILRKFGAIPAVLHGYIKSKTTNGVEIGGVKCSPIKIGTMCADMGGLRPQTLYRHLSTLTEAGYIVSSSRVLHSPLECDLDKTIRATRRYVFFGVVERAKI